MSSPLRVLIVEDSPSDAELLLRKLRQNGYDVTTSRVDTAEAMNEALDRQDWDVVLADYVMPNFSGPAALELLKARGLDLPFIVVSGRIGEDVAVEMMKAGAHDYILKGNLVRLVPAVQRELREAEARRARRSAEAERDRLIEQLRQVNEQLVTSSVHVAEQADEVERRVLTQQRTTFELNGLAEAIAGRLIARGESVAVAESAAGGLISAALLGVAGASAYFKGGVVAYSLDGKLLLAGMTREQIAAHRSATVPHAELLARSIRERLGATWGIAETGAAGPTGNRYGDPAGHVALAVSGPVERARAVQTGSADRRANMEAFAVAALRLLQELLA